MLWFETVLGLSIYQYWWKKSVKSAIKFGLIEGAQDVVGNAGGNYIRLETTLMTKLFEGSDIDELIQRNFEHIKRQVENYRTSERDFMQDQIMY